MNSEMMETNDSWALYYAFYYVTVGYAPATKQDSVFI